MNPLELKYPDSNDLARSPAPAGISELPANFVCIYDNGDNYRLLEEKLAGLGYGAIDCRYHAPDPGCVAVLVSADADPQLEISHALSTSHHVILVAEDRSFEFQLAAARAGVGAVLWSPVDTVELGAWLSEYNESEKPHYSILIVDDDELLAETYAAALGAAGMSTHVVTDPFKVGSAIAAVTPDLVLLDLNMPKASGLEVARVIRQSRQHLSLPLVFLSAESDSERRHLARKIGGDDFIAKSIKLDDLTALVRIRADRARSLRHIMERDSLTGLLNHARFKDRLAAEIDRSNRTGAPLTVSLVDLDHFKRVNDTFGHQAGDRVIQTLSHLLTGMLRRTDVIARYGGEEFAILLLDTDADHTKSVMDKIRQAFSAIEIESGEEHFSVTLSAGIAGFHANATAEELIRAADEALYAAKESGRNRVCIGDMV